MLRVWFSSSTALSGPILVGIGLMTAACQSESREDAVAVGMAADHAQTGLAGAGTACANYVRVVCAKAGDATPTCAAFKSAVELMSEQTCSVGLDDVVQSLEKFAAVRKPCTQLREDLCNSFGVDSEMCDFVTVQTGLFPVEQCSGMQNNLPSVIDDLMQLQAAKKTLSPDLAAAIAAGEGPGFGPPGAKIEIVEFSDFECPFCAQAARVIQAIRERYADEVRFVFRQFPLPIHPNAELAARASVVAHRQGRFWEFHDRVFQSDGPLDRPTLERIAGAAGLEPAHFASSLTDPSVEQAVEFDVLLGKQIEIGGTPALFINGRRVEHPTDLATVVNAIDRALRDITRN